MNGQNYSPPLFREEQRFRQPILWILGLSGCVMGLSPLIRQVIWDQPMGNNHLPDWAAVIIIFLMAGLPLFFWKLRLVTEVRSDGVYFRFVPLHFSFQKIHFSSIRRYRACTYHPIADYGGWGIRQGWWGKGKAYNISGNRGVKFEFAEGRPLLIGSQRPEEFARAIEQASGIAPS
jgi:hypothetical protein